MPAFDAGAVVETAGAGDAFNGAFAAALARGLEPEAAVRFGCAAAGISVTAAGTAPSMPHLAEIEALLERVRSDEAGRLEGAGVVDFRLDCFLPSAVGLSEDEAIPGMKCRSGPQH